MFNVLLVKFAKMVNVLLQLSNHVRNFALSVMSAKTINASQILLLLLQLISVLQLDVGKVTTAKMETVFLKLVFAVL